MNCVVYSQLEVATVGGIAHHLVKQHEENKDKYSSWNSLCEWYYGVNVNNKTKNYLMSKL